VPLVRLGGTTRALGWGEALAALIERLKGLESTTFRAVGSPFASNEDLATLAALAELGSGNAIYRMRHAPDEVVLKGFPKLARRHDLAPNGRGAELFGMGRVGDDQGAGGLDEVGASNGLLIVLGDDLADQPETFGASAELYIYLGHHGTPAATHAHFVLPVTTFAEHEGTFTNLHGRVQRFWPALEAPGVARPAWLVLGHVLAALTGGAPATTTEAAFETLVGGRSEFEGLGYADIGTRGALVNEPAGLLGGAGQGA
jgi:NADH dehydrogenase/NADH:ubiquinone oxidoreductase subunit G